MDTAESPTEVYGKNGKPKRERKPRKSSAFIVLQTVEGEGNYQRIGEGNTIKACTAALRELESGTFVIACVRRTVTVSTEQKNVTTLKVIK